MTSDTNSASTPLKAVVGSGDKRDGTLRRTMTASGIPVIMQSVALGRGGGAVFGVWSLTAWYPHPRRSVVGFLTKRDIPLSMMTASAPGGSTSGNGRDTSADRSDDRTTT